MADEKVTPIRPDVTPVKPRASRSERQEARTKDRLYDFQTRVQRAAALVRSLALALDGQVLAFDIEPTEGCMGVAELLDAIAGDMDDLLSKK